MLVFCFLVVIVVLCISEVNICILFYFMVCLFVCFYLVVEDQASLGYICSKTAVPYFSNLVWFIGNHVIELDECLIAQAQ